MIGQKNREVSLLSKKVEAFALNLLHLVRGVRVYPSRHPTLLEVAKNVLKRRPLRFPGVSNNWNHIQGIGGIRRIRRGKKRVVSRRCFTHEKVLRLLWTKDVTLDDVWTFAKVISVPNLKAMPCDKNSAPKSPPSTLNHSSSTRFTLRSSIRIRIGGQSGRKATSGLARPDDSGSPSRTNCRSP